MNQPRNLQLRTPGAQVTPPPDDGLGETNADALSADTSDVAIPAPEPVAPPDLSDPAVLAAYIAEQVRQGVNSAMSAAKRASMPQEVKLPDQSEVDPAKITTPVLTKQGYVVPTNYGAIPAHLRQNQMLINQVN